MATVQEHITLYGELRAELLSRYFAYDRYFRANHLSLTHTLGFLHQKDSEASDRDSPAVDCEGTEYVRPGTYTDWQNLLAQDPVVVQEVERWRIARRVRENPLLYGSHLMVALTVEHLIGRKDSLPILRLAIETIGSLYKFQGNHMDGYIIRWDPVTCDRWVTTNDHGRQKPLYCCEFLLDDNADYLYCTPFNHPEYTAYNPAAYPGQNPATNDADDDRKRSLEYYRNWEPSMDELVGLVLSYDFVYRSVDDEDLRMEIRRQVSNLGDYLAEHGYLLVRPCGGFSARGGSGALPALEFPFNRVFERITGTTFPSRASFERAAELAGVWPCLQPYMRMGMVIGIAAPVLLTFAISTLTGLLPAAIPALGIIFTIIALLGLAGAYLGYIGGIYLGRDCFDVAGDDARGEFIGAHLLKLLPARQRFTFWMSLVDRGRHARNFPQFLGLTALKDPNTTVRNAFLANLQGERVRKERGFYGETGFATAVAVALGETGESAELRRWLDTAYDNFDSQQRRRMIKLEADEDFQGKVRERVREGVAPYVAEDPMGALEYLACLALCWYAVNINGEQPAEDGLVAPPGDPSAWPTPNIPSRVLASGVVPALSDLAGNGGPAPRMPEPLRMFPSDEQTPPSRDSSKPDVPPPALPAPAVTNEYTIIVRESDGDVNTNIPIYYNDRVAITAFGEIWAGVWATGNNGPGGWNNIDNDNKFPLPGSHPFCLLYKLVPQTPQPNQPSVKWRRLGSHSGTPPTSKLGFIGRPQATWLYFRINDDTPGNGSGYFTCTIKVERPPH